MRCVICKHGETYAGTTTLTVERQNMTLVVKSIPAQICENCGEAYVDEEVTQQLLDLADSAAKAGVQVDVRQFIVA